MMEQAMAMLLMSLMMLCTGMQAFPVSRVVPAQIEQSQTDTDQAQPRESDGIFDGSALRYREAGFSLSLPLGWVVEKGELEEDEVIWDFAYPKEEDVEMIVLAYRAQDEYTLEDYTQSEIDALFESLREQKYGNLSLSTLDNGTQVVNGTVSIQGDRYLTAFFFHNGYDINFYFYGAVEEAELAQTAADILQTIEIE